MANAYEKIAEQAARHEKVQTVMHYVNKANLFVVDADIKGFFDNVDHEWLMKFLEHDTGDKNFLRYIKRFLKAGKMEEATRIERDKGPPRRTYFTSVGEYLSALCTGYVVRQSH